MLDRDFPPILLSQECTYNRSLLLAESMPRNVVGNGEEDERVQGDCEACVRRLGGEERVGCHDD